MRFAAPWLSDLFLRGQESVSNKKVSRTTHPAGLIRHFSDGVSVQNRIELADKFIVVAKIASVLFIGDTEDSLGPLREIRAYPSRRFTYRV